MRVIKLVPPTLDYESQILSYRTEFLTNQESMDGTSFLGEFSEIKEWIACIEKNSHLETVGEGLVVATEFLAIREIDDRLIGMVSIRHTLNEYLYHFGGHIGYSVRKSERNQGYVKGILFQSLNWCKKIHLDKILITCDRKNSASAKVIRFNGGWLEDEVFDEEDKEIVQRYWISL